MVWEVVFGLGIFPLMGMVIVGIMGWGTIREGMVKPMDGGDDPSPDRKGPGSRKTKSATATVVHIGDYRKKNLKNGEKKSDRGRVTPEVLEIA